MRNITCIAIDDEPMALLVIERFCRRKGGISLTVFSEPQIGLEAIRKQKPDLVFLDIQMHSINGLEIADTLPQECLFIFTTAYAEYAFDGFNLDAVDFLHKPFSYERFEIAVGKALRRINAREAATPKSIVVKQGYSNVNIQLSDILYIEALGNYVKIIRYSGGSVLTRNNLKSIYDLLPSEMFLRIHRSYVVSVDGIVAYTHAKVILKGNKSLPIGAQYVSYVTGRLGG